MLDRLLGRSEPELQAVSVGRFLLISNHRLDQPVEITQELESLHRRLQSELELPPIEGTVRVYIFEKHGTFSHYVRQHIPYLARFDTNRNGLFLLRNGVPHIFVVKTDDLNVVRSLRERNVNSRSGPPFGRCPTTMASLRHEFAHVFLNSAVPGLPIWLDEGLAMYYQSANLAQSSPEQIEPVVREQRADLERLERLRTMRQMGPREYAESKAWVSTLMNGSPQLRELIPEYLADLRNDRDAATLSERLRQ